MVDDEPTGKQGPGAEQPHESHGNGLPWWRDLELYDNERLEAAINEFTVQMHMRAGSPTANWEKAAEKHLENVRHHQGEFHAAWSAWKAARRELVHAWGWMELLLEADRISREATAKLRGWRLQFVEDALDVPAIRHLRKGATASFHIESPDSPGKTSVGLGKDADAARTEVAEHMSAGELADLRDRVKSAWRIFDEYQDNVYLRLRLLRGHLIRAGWVLGTMLMLVSVVLFFVLWNGWSPSDEDVLLADWKSLLMVVVLGALGAALSGVLTLLARDTGQGIPDVRAQRTLVWLRPVIGAAAAVIVVGIVRSGLGGLKLDPEAAFVAALVAGSSERLVSRAVASASAAIGG